MKMTIGCLFAWALTMQTITSLAAGVDWYRWRGPDLNGISKESGWNQDWNNAAPQRLWKASVGIGFASVTVSEGKVYTTGNKTNHDTIFCFDAATGKVVWRHSFESPLDPRYYDGGTSATPTIDNGQAYVFSRKGWVFALEKDSGKVIWSKNIAKELNLDIPEWGFAGSPLLIGPTLFLNAGTSGVALDKATGKMIWQTGKESSGYSSPVPYEHQGTRQLLFFNKEHLSAVSETSGSILWRHPFKTSYDINAADPIPQGPQIFITAGYDHGCELIDVSESKPKIVWGSKVIRGQFSSPVLIHGHLYGIDGNNGRDCFLRCVEWSSGKEKWAVKGTSMGSLMAADGKLIVQWDKGELVLVDAVPDSYKELGRFQALGGKCWTQPVLSQGQIYCRNAAGDLVAFSVRKP